MVLYISILVLKTNLSYEGCTMRFWETRLQEHTHVSGLTGKPLLGIQISTPMQHVRSGCHVKVERDNFSIIGHEKDPYLVQLKESIIINTSRPLITCFSSKLMIVSIDFNFLLLWIMNVSSSKWPELASVRQSLKSLIYKRKVMVQEWILGGPHK